MPERIDGLDLDASAALEITFGEQLDKFGHQIDSLAGVLDAMFDRHAIPLSVNASKNAATGVATLLDAGGPAVGRFWEVMAVTVLGNDDHTALANTFVAFYVGIPAANNLSDLVLPGTQAGTGVTVPANSQFSRRQIMVQYPQHAYFLVYGAANGQLLNANVRGWDRDVTELPLR